MANNILKMSPRGEVSYHGQVVEFDRAGNLTCYIEECLQAHELNFLRNAERHYVVDFSYLGLRKIGIPGPELLEADCGAYSNH